MIRTLKSIFIVLAVVCFTQSCENKLDLSPEDDRLTADAAFEDPASYRAFLAKIYAGISLSGQEGPAGNPDLAGLDEGFSNYLRLYWKMQELTTDEAIIGWDDGTIKDLHAQNWTSGNEFIRTMYSRILYQTALCNEFLRQTTDDKLDARGVDSDLRAEIQNYRAEARFMRALSYWHAMDLFANIPFVTEDDPIGAFLPEQIQRADLFSYIESELLDIEGSIVGARQNEYGRADRAAVWMLLAKLYLNAEVYTGTARNAEVITYTNNVINAGYMIPSNPYYQLFLADNDSNGAEDEVIFPIPFDGLSTQSFGGMTFLVHAPVGGSMDPADFGINGGWFGVRTTSAFVDKFTSQTIDISGANDALGTLSNWGIIGSATPNGWADPDEDMYETGANQYALYLNLVAGEIKFRLDDAWTVNLGDNDADGSLEQDGANIAIDADGTYFITLDTNNSTYSISLIEGDSRAMFYTDGQSLEIDNVAPFNNGYAVEKFRNVDVNGNPGSDMTGDHPDTDYPMFRLADAYLMYAEAVVRGGGGSISEAVNYINTIRQRAYGNNLGDITSGDLTLDFILDERSRELYWEGHRRTDLIRFGQFSDQGIWPWKGNVPQGAPTEAFRDIMPIPASDLGVNTNLTQNPGY
ncbi:MAG: RagB/SusD family nutrient uptake outer membrane protein [Bacteroidia bacterium]|nr:RagB/SusD family nutrient uptake outer membrane protein [Bacteroidia bacterium]NND26495.1 RagB/SusD family nutrient uptake outer membrane protein [Flavobacteriaceae bacterium]MBT8279722.1 RagB/SusD family nutrient uptake outer membrane protein [Bacteroidia bacterium]NNK60407.1 RagB/SusD family nutrient uptake outer membrane protein [Flavobacteriaceae bacterium]NNL34060.1 RagB/SusD family nutrient uptake outer membrane protein [Flavobacteriaceae bacterium]